jgi:hypothetical protein
MKPEIFLDITKDWVESPYGGYTNKCVVRYAHNEEEIEVIAGIMAAQQFCKDYYPGVWQVRDLRKK